LNTLELSEASPKFLIIRENPGPQEESGACLIVVEENLNISKSKFFKEIQMTNKLMIAMMMAVISWIGNEAAAQQTDAADGPNLDQQIKEPQEKVNRAQRSRVQENVEAKVPSTDWTKMAMEKSPKLKPLNACSSGLK
jgi:hypothetical protein